MISHQKNTKIVPKIVKKSRNTLEKKAQKDIIKRIFYFMSVCHENQHAMEIFFE